MAWILDGSNVLGVLRWNRESRDSKERLTTLCARFARHERKRVVLLFDGAAPSGFARKFGGVTVRFSHPRDADSIIVQLAAHARDKSVVVTSDSELAHRVARRNVHVVRSDEFVSQLKALDEEPGDKGDGTIDGDWEEYFSDPKNRVF